MVQLASVFVLVILPICALYTHYKEARAIADLPKNKWHSVAVHGIDRFVGESAFRKKLVEQTQGTIWSARIFGVSISDPLAGAEAIVSSRSLYVPLLWSLLIPVVVTVLLGRVFCGWMCPMNTLLELVDKCRGVLRLLEIRSQDAKFSLKNKYLMLGLAIGFVALTGVPFLAMVYPPAVLSREMHALVFRTGVGVSIYLMLAICAFELFVSKRWWCRYICPGGALYSWLGRFRLVRVRRDENKCVQCGDCVCVCQFDLRPMLVKTTGMECTNCASCIAGCNSNALRYSIVLPWPKKKTKDELTNDEGMTTDERPNDEAVTNDELLDDEPNDSVDSEQPVIRTVCHSRFVILASFVIRHSTFPRVIRHSSLILLALLPSIASAHHILGLPHYSYKENYPQVPTLEYPATTGPYDILMTSYPGKPVPGEAATIAFYIKDRITNTPYAQPVTVRVLKTSTFGSNDIIFEPATHQPFDNQHKYTITFPSDGEYITELTMEVEGQEEVIPFLMVAGNPTATQSIVIAMTIGLALFIIVVRAVKVKHERRKKAQQRTASDAHAVNGARMKKGVAS